MPPPPATTASTPSVASMTIPASGAISTVRPPAWNGQRKAWPGLW
jgi:hypothetical protein